MSQSEPLWDPGLSPAWTQPQGNKAHLTVVWSENEAVLKRLPAHLEDFPGGSDGKDSGCSEGNTAQAQAHSVLLRPQNLPLI